MIFQSTIVEKTHFSCIHAHPNSIIMVGLSNVEEEQWWLQNSCCNYKHVFLLPFKPIITKYIKCTYTSHYMAQTNNTFYLIGFIF
jgi:hypothetical protein